MANSYKTFKFVRIEFVGNWRLDWGTNGQARYKPRENARIKVTTTNDKEEDITPAQEDVVVVTGDTIHIPIE